MRKGPESVYDKWKISVVICDTNVPQWLTSHGDDGKTFEVTSST